MLLPSRHSRQGSVIPEDAVYNEEAVSRHMRSSTIEGRSNYTTRFRELYWTLDSLKLWFFMHCLQGRFKKRKPMEQSGATGLIYIVRVVLEKERRSCAKVHETSVRWRRQRNQRPFSTRRRQRWVKTATYHSRMFACSADVFYHYSCSLVQGFKLHRDLVGKPGEGEY